METGEKIPPTRTTWWMSGNMGIGHNTISAGIYDALHLQPSLSTLDAHLQVSWWLRRRRSEDPRNLEFGTLGPFPYQNFVFLCVFDSLFIYLGQVSADTWRCHDSPAKSHGSFKLIIISNIQTFHRTKSLLKSRWFARLRFFRMVRLVRLLRYMPEVIILVKGLGVASRCQAASCELWWGYPFFWEVDIAAIAYILQLVIPLVTNSR